MTQIKSFINKNWDGINFPSENDDWEKLEKNNVTISFNVSYDKKEKIYPTFVSKHNSNCEKQDIFLMISNGEKYEARFTGRLHYFAVKNYHYYYEE